MQQPNNGQELKLAPGEELWPETVTIGNTDWATDDLAAALDAIADWSHGTTEKLGFYKDPAFEGPIGEAALISMIHSELGEATDAIREGNPNSTKIPGHSSVEEEMADVILRTLCFCRQYGYDVSAVISKAIYNDRRPPMHGGKKF